MLKEYQSYSGASGGATLENSSTSSLPPGLSTRRISARARSLCVMLRRPNATLTRRQARSEEHTSELQSRENLVCRLLLEKKNFRNSSIARGVGDAVQVSQQVVEEVRAPQVTRKRLYLDTKCDVKARTSKALDEHKDAHNI